MLLRHTFIYALARGLPGIAGFLAISAYTRLLTPDEYGSYSLIVAAVTLANALLFEWNRAGVLRYLPSMHGESKTIFMSALLKGFITLFIISLAVSPVMFLWTPVTWKFLMLMGIGLLTLWSYAWNELNLTLLRSQLQPGIYGAVFTAKTMLTIGVGIALVMMGFGEMGLLLGMIVGLIVPAMFLSYRNWGNVRWVGNTKPYTIMMVKYGAPLTLTSSLGFIIFYSGRFFLGLNHDLAEAGVYSVAYDLTQKSLILIMTVVNLAGLPLMVKKLGKELGGQEVEQLKQNVTLLLFLSIPATVGMALLSGNLSQVLLGAEYRSHAALIIPWVAVAAFLQGLKTYYFDIAFQIGQKTIIQLVPVMLSLLINIILNVSLIPAYGSLGAAFSAIFSYFSSLLLSYFIGQRIYRLPFPVKELLKILVSVAAMSLSILPMIHERGVTWLVIQCLAGIGAYFAAAFVMNAGNVRGLGLKVYERLNRKSRLKMLKREEGAVGGSE